MPSSLHPSKYQNHKDYHSAIRCARGLKLQVLLLRELVGAHEEEPVDVKVTQEDAEPLTSPFHPSLYMHPAGPVLTKFPRPSAMLP